MRQLLVTTVLMCSGCLLTSIEGLGSTAGAGTSSGASSGGSTSASSSSGGSTSGGTAGRGIVCGDAGAICQPNEYCLSFGSFFCQPLLDCKQGGGGFPGNACPLDGGLVGYCCGDECVDLSSDANCTFCDLACPVGAGCDGYHGCGLGPDCGGLPCPAGDVCVRDYGCLPTTCMGDQLSCALDGGFGFCCGDTCSSSSMDCGGSCPLGTIRSTTNYGCKTIDGGRACTEGAICPDGTICSSIEGDCSPLDTCARFSPNGSLDCPFGVDDVLQGRCCGTTCTDTAQDPNNCSGCGVVCASGICTSVGLRGYGVGQCLPVGPTDDCAVSCPANAICLDGQCIDGSCPGSTFCLAENGSIGMCCADGTCAHPLDDPLNCGGCGNVCAYGGICIGGSCTNFPGCGLGRMYSYCNPDAGPDFLCCPSIGCTDTAIDPENCGACGVLCDAGATCLAGVCQT